MTTLCRTDLQIQAQSFDIEADLQLAKEVQATFLPQHPPFVEGIDIYADHKFAHMVGGDFYDFMRGASDSLIFAIGDVSYKGMSAALMMAVLRKVLRTASKVVDEVTPCRILDYTNANMYEELSNNGMFATVLIGQYQPETKCLSLSSAGHGPVFYRRANGQTQMVEATNVPLGVLDQASYVEHQIQMKKDDLLVALTDGYMESQNQSGTSYGYDSLFRIIDATADGSPREIAQAIQNEVCHYNFGVQDCDDQALLIIKSNSA